MKKFVCLGLALTLSGCGSDETGSPSSISPTEGTALAGKNNPPPSANKPSPTPTPTPTPSQAVRYNFTNGTSSATPYQVGVVTTREEHGNRIYCTISHFSYEDPIIYPNEPGRAHLHMFWGNTALDAFTTSSSILTTGRSSCEGGNNYRVGAWIPALFNPSGEVIIPEEAFIYYKTFGPPYMNYSMLQVIPQGLAMLASSATRNFTGDKISTGYIKHDDRMTLLLNISFPSCVATDNGQMTGNPIISYRDMPGSLAIQVNSHVAYPGSGNEVGCPISHPYRFATPQFLVYFDANEAVSGSYLSSDTMAGASPLSTLHGDYMFGADPSANQAILQCVREARRCGFDEGDRGQLPDRFFGPAGQVYKNSVTLLDATDRTPFGNSLKPSLHEGHDSH